MKVEIAYLKTIKNYAMSNGVTASYIYKLIKENRMSAVTVDGVQFIDTKEYPVIPKK